MTVYRTDNNGNIVLTVGETLTFTVEKEVDASVNLDGWTDEEIKADEAE